MDDRKQARPLGHTKAHLSRSGKVFNSSLAWLINCGESLGSVLASGPGWWRRLLLLLRGDEETGIQGNRRQAGASVTTGFILPALRCNEIRFPIPHLGGPLSCATSSLVTTFLCLILGIHSTGLRAGALLSPPSFRKPLLPSSEWIKGRVYQVTTWLPESRLQLPMALDLISRATKAERPGRPISL
jgi:hypothetical protein